MSNERDVETDLKNNLEVCQKIASSDVYAQHVYAALCNQQFFPKGAPQNDDTVWSCTWRYAGGLIAEIRNAHYHEPQHTGIEEDYIHWYCSGMGMLEGAVSEGVVTDEMRQMFNNMGWDIVAYPSEWGV